MCLAKRSSLASRRRARPASKTWVSVLERQRSLAPELGLHDVDDVPAARAVP